MKLTQPLKLFFFVFLAFVFITYAYFPVLFTGFSTMIETNDGRFVSWDLSWDIHSMLTDPGHIFQANIFYPNPHTLSYSEHFIGTSLWGIPVWLITGGNPAATFNFLMIMGYVLNAFFSFLLIRKLVKNNTAAFLGAFVNGFCSYRLWNIGHLQNVFIFYIPLCLWMILKFIETNKVRYLVGIGLCVLLQSLSSWYHMIFLLLLILLVVLYHLFVTKSLTRKAVLKIGISVAAACLLVIPFALPYLVQNRENQTAYGMNDIISSDLGGYLLAPPDTFLWEVFHNYFGITKTRWLENFNFIGYVPFMLCCLAVFRFYKNSENRNVLALRKETRLFFLIAVLFFILSLGPYFIINDNPTSVPLPYYLIFKFLSPIRFLRVVSRYSTVVLLMTSILSAYAISDLLANSSTRGRKILALLFLLVFIGEYTPIKRFDRFTNISNVPKIYQFVKNDSSVKAMVELPINVDPFTTTQYLYYAGIHFKPIMNGYSGYEPPSYQEFKTMFDSGLQSFAASVLNANGVTHLLCNPGYNQTINPAYADLILEKDGYKLYRLKPLRNELMFSEDILQPKKKNKPAPGNPLKVVRSLNGLVFNPTNPYSPIANMSPEKVNFWSNATYSSNRSMKTLYIRFRTYAATDSLQILCFKEAPDRKADSLVKAFNFSNTSEFLYKNAELDVSGATRIELKLYATEFPDRTFINKFSFTTVKYQQ